MRKFVVVGAVAVLSLGVAACGGPAKGALTAAQIRQAQQESSSSSTATTMGTNGTSSASGNTTSSSTAMGSTTAGATASTSSSMASTSSSATTGGSADTAKGKTLFQGPCAGCHTLSDAGATGNVGPNLDQLKPSQEVVLNQIMHGGGGMPANLYSGQDAVDVAAYVASVAGK